jgi:hypothetical protein
MGLMSATKAQSAGFTCDHCQKHFLDKRGLAGHLAGVHQVRIGLHQDVNETKHLLERNVIPRLTMIMDFSLPHLEKRIDELEKILKKS